MNYEKVFKALADEKRMRILKTLNNRGRTCVCHLVEEFELSQSKLSYHLKLLLDADLVSKTSEGKWNYYDINKTVLGDILKENVVKEILG